MKRLIDIEDNQLDLRPRSPHRGPDGQGHKAMDHAWLGHRHLAIVDVERGGQPLHDPERGLWLVGDGGVYNHLRLRGELEQRGHTFATCSDHEMVLHLLAADGPPALTRLWGCSHSLRPAKTVDSSPHANCSNAT